jgi:hypothetical protein
MPKKSVGMSSRPTSGMSVLLLISMLIFFVSVGIGGWVFLEKKILVQRITDEQKVIESNKNGLISDGITIDSIVLLDSRINLAKQLLAKHTDITPVFDFLQKATLKNVQFKTFAFSSAGQSADGKSGVGIQLSGQGRDFESVAVQADEFGKPDWKNIIKEPQLTNVSLNGDGSVSFSFSALIIPECLSFSKTSSSCLVAQIQ